MWRGTSYKTTVLLFFDKTLKKNRKFKKIKNKKSHNHCKEPLLIVQLNHTCSSAVEELKIDIKAL